MSEGRGIALLVLAAALLAAVAVVSAAEAESGAAEESPTDAYFPGPIGEAATDIIRTRAGTEFTASHVRFDPSTSKVKALSHGDGLRYSLRYRIVIAEHDLDYAMISVRLDVQDGAVTETHLYGVPECIRQPLDCEVTVPRAEAVAIAAREGLGGSPERWDVFPRWREEHGFVWYVEWARPEDSYSQHVDYLAIDADTGDVLRRMQHIRFINPG